MLSHSHEDLHSKVQSLLEQIPYLRLLILFGSRARGDNASDSDWDFAFLCDEDGRSHYEQGGWDRFRISSLLGQVLELPNDAIDFVDLKDCPDLLVHQISQDGQVIYEKEPGEFERFRQSHLKSPEQMQQIGQNLSSSIRERLQQWSA